MKKTAKRVILAVVMGVLLMGSVGGVVIAKTDPDWIPGGSKFDNCANGKGSLHNGSKAACAKYKKYCNKSSHKSETKCARWQKWKSCWKGNTALTSDDCKDYRMQCEANKVVKNGKLKYKPSGCKPYAKAVNNGTVKSEDNQGGDKDPSSGGGDSDDDDEDATNPEGNNSTGTCNNPEEVATTFFGCVDPGTDGSGIYRILDVVLNVLTAGVGILGVVGFVWSGILYITARDNEGQIVKAKNRMLQIVIGLFLYATMWALLNFLLPGGVFANNSTSAIIVISKVLSF